MKSYIKIRNLRIEIFIIVFIHSIGNGFTAHHEQNGNIYSTRIIPLSTTNANFFQTKEALKEAMFSVNASKNLLSEAQGDTSRIVKLFIEGLKKLNAQNYESALQDFQDADRIRRQPVLIQCMAQTRFFMEEKGAEPEISRETYMMAIVNYTRLERALNRVRLYELFDINETSSLPNSSLLLSEMDITCLDIGENPLDIHYQWKSEIELGEWLDIKYFATLANISPSDYSTENISHFIEDLKHQINSQLVSLFHNQGTIALYKAIHEADSSKKEVYFGLSHSYLKEAFQYLEELPNETGDTDWRKAKAHYMFGILLFKSSNKPQDALYHIKMATDLGHADTYEMQIYLEGRELDETIK